MSEDNPDLTVTQKLAMQRIRQRFEDSLRRGDPRGMETSLAEVDASQLGDAEKSSLLYDLILLELTQRAADNLTLELADYLARFPGQQSCVYRAFEELARQRQQRPIRIDDAHLQPGMRLGRYRIECEVARGGMGCIYRVQDEQLNRPLALKVVHPAIRTTGAGSLGSNDAELARFFEEAQITAQLDHPGIVPVYELGGQDQREPYFTMSLVKGKNLKEIFDLAQEGREGWNQNRAVGTLVKACDATAYAHSRRVIHRDLKPANIMVGRYGAVYVMDWGLAKVAGQNDLHDIRPQLDESQTRTRIRSTRDSTHDSTDSPLITMDGSVLGTPAYMPPEQAKGWVDEVDEASDIYSLGAILYTLLAGQAPYVEPGSRISARTILGMVIQGPPRRVREINPHAPAELVAICEKAMAREKTMRYGSSLELAEDLQCYLDGRVVRAFQTGPAAELKSWMARNRATAWSGLVATCLLVLGIVLAVVLAARAKHLAEVQRLIGLQQYVRDMDTASRFWDSGNVDWATTLSEQHQRSPHRSFEYSHLDFSYQLSRKSLVSRLEHGEAVTAVGFSDAGDNLATGTNDGEIFLWDITKPKPTKSTLAQTDASVRRLFFLADGSRLISVHDQGLVYLWDLARTPDSPGASLSAPTTLLEDPSISPYGLSIGITRDTRYLAAICGNDAYLCDLSSTDPPSLLQADHPIRMLRFTPDDRYLVAAGDEGEITRWSVETREAQNQWMVGKEPKGRIFYIDVSGDEKIAAVTERRLYLLDMRTGEQTDVVEGQFSEYCSPEFCHSGTRLAALAANGEFLFYRVSGDGKLERISTSPGHRGVGKHLVSLGGTPELVATLGGDNHELCLWDASDGRIRARYRGHGNDVYCLGVSRDGNRIATGGRDADVFLWSTRNQHPSNELLSPSTDWRCVRSLAFSHDGRTLLSGDESGTISVWDVPTGTFAGYLGDTSQRPGQGQPSRPRAHAGKTLVRVVPGSSEIAVSIGQNGTLKAWSLSSRLLLRQRPTDQSFISCLAISPDGNTIYTGDDRGKLRSWRTADFADIPEIRTEMEGDIWAVACSPDRLAFGGTDTKVHIWSLSGQREIQVLDQHTDFITSLDFSEDGMALASGSHDGTVRLWQAKSGTAKLAEVRQSPLRAHTSDVITLQFYPDGKSLASAGFDQVIHLWDFETGTVKTTLRGHRHWIFSLAFSPNAATLASGSFSNYGSEPMIRLWRTSQSQ